MNTDLHVYRRDDFFNALKKVFFDLNGENLPIYGVVRMLYLLYSM